MTQADRSRIGIAVVLVLLGAWFLAVQFSPALQVWMFNRTTWPFAVIGVGVLLLLIGLVLGVPEMLIPACIVGGIGGILYYQNATGNWSSWSYAWTLIPGFVGVGIFLSALLRGNVGRAFNSGGSLIVVSLVLFLLFGSFFGTTTMLGPYWPVLLIVLGLILLVRGFVSRRSADTEAGR